MNLTEKKIINGIKYFVKNTKNVGRTKLFKLLYFLDFLHFKKHGLSVTGYDYYTFPFGPVPKKLYNEIIENSLSELFRKNLSIVEENNEEEDGYKKFKVIIKDKKIDFDYFTPNEQKTLEEVAFIFSDATAKEMTEITHLPNTPWSKTLEQGMDKKISYFMALEETSSVDLDLIKEKFTLQQELHADGRI